MQKQYHDTILINLSSTYLVIAHWYRLIIHVSTIHTVPRLTIKL